MKLYLTLFLITALSGTAQQRDPFKGSVKKQEKKENLKQVDKRPEIELVGLMVMKKSFLAAVNLKGKVLYLKEGSLVISADTSVWKVKEITKGQLVLENTSSKKSVVYL